MLRILAATVLAAGALTSCGETKEESNDLVILYEQDDSMINTYSMIAVDPNAPFVSSVDETLLEEGSVKLNTAGADALIKWMSSDEGLQAIKSYGYDEYGEYLFYLLDGAEKYNGTIPSATADTKEIRVSTTTSVKDSGLLGYLLPIFEQNYGYEVAVASAGTGKAIAQAKYGNADLILVHAKAQEEAFIDAGFARKVEGFSKERLSFMYNYFVLVGPEKDPAKAKSAATVLDAFKNISSGSHKFVSRGDNSGTHTKEISLWSKDLGITVEAPSFKDYSWYISANTGMGACLTLAKENEAYILSDKATFLSWNKDNQAK